MRTDPKKTEFGNSQESTSTINSLSQERTTESNVIQIPEISLPKDGGSLKGIDEKLEDTFSLLGAEGLVWFEEFLDNVPSINHPLN